jgi:hypothetical protein
MTPYFIYSYEEDRKVEYRYFIRPTTLNSINLSTKEIADAISGLQELFPEINSTTRRRRLLQFRGNLRFVWFICKMIIKLDFPSLQGATTWEVWDLSGDAIQRSLNKNYKFYMYPITHSNKALDLLTLLGQEYPEMWISQAYRAAHFNSRDLYALFVLMEDMD